MLGHMKHECDLVVGEESLIELPDERLPFGDWLRASPEKQARVSFEARRQNTDTSSLRRKRFEKFKDNIDSKNRAQDLDKEDDISEPKIESSEVAEV
ncbi:hypothetical protein ACS0TY_013919 [Phlomoides rotata]